MFNCQTLLDIDSGSKFHCGTDHNPDFAGIYPFIQIGFLLIGVVIGNDCYFICRNSIDNEFSPQFFPGIEKFSVAVQVTENDLRTFDGVIFLVFFQNFLTADIEL